MDVEGQPSNREFGRGGGPIYGEIHLVCSKDGVLMIGSGGGGTMCLAGAFAFTNWDCMSG